jgi:uncharacterized protein
MAERNERDAPSHSFVRPPSASPHDVRRACFVHLCLAVSCMNVAVLGATGNIGRRLVSEALERGHRVTALARHAQSMPPHPGLHARSTDLHDAWELEDALREKDALLSCVGPGAGEPAVVVVDAARAVAAACMRTGLRRVLIIGGAGSLSVKPGLELLNTDTFPEASREIALAHHAALEIWRKVKELDWTVISPPALIFPGLRTGRYRTGHNDLLVDEHGQSRISTEDFASGTLDELEKRAHVHERITFAY